VVDHCNHIKDDVLRELLKMMMSKS